jgi:hypothetical protein
VKSWLTGAGLRVTQVETHNRYVAIRGSVAAAEAAFGVSIHRYRHDGLTVQAPSGSLSVPASVAGSALAVSGLDTRGRPPLPRTGEPRGCSGADGPDVDPVAVECLQCGTTRVARRDRFKHFESPECPECGYLGWTPVLDVKEAEPRASRERRRAARRLPSVA